MIEPTLRKISNDVFSLTQDRILIRQKFRLKRKTNNFKSFKEIKIEEEKITHGFSYTKIPDKYLNYYSSTKIDPIIN